MSLNPVHLLSTRRESKRWVPFENEFNGDQTWLLAAYVSATEKIDEGGSGPPAPKNVSGTTNSLLLAFVVSRIMSGGGREHEKFWFFPVGFDDYRTSHQLEQRAEFKFLWSVFGLSLPTSPSADVRREDAYIGTRTVGPSVHYLSCLPSPPLITLLLSETTTDPEHQTAPGRVGNQRRDRLGLARRQSRLNRAYFKVSH